MTARSANGLRLIGSWLVVAVVAISAGIGLQRALSANSRLVAIHMQSSEGAGVRFEIPVAYLSWSDDRAGGVSDGLIRLVTHYPDMSPAARRNDDSKPLNSSLQPLQFELLIDIRASDSNAIAAAYSDIVRQENLVDDANEPGFFMYRAVWAGQTREYLVPIGQNGANGRLETVLDCGPYLDGTMTKRLFGMCVGHVQPIDQFYIEYEIPRRTVDQWRDVENKVMSLVRSFVSDSEVGQE